MNLPAKAIARFWSKVDVRSTDDCWPWKAGRFEKGYGAFSYKRRLFRANRVALSLSMSRPLPARVKACHSCDNPCCCNPKHLWPGTELQNISDRDRKGRNARGASVNTAKLTAAQVVAIISDTRAQRAIAREYGVCKSTIEYIKRGEIWRHVS